MIGVLEGDTLVQMHCYRGEEMVIMLDVAKEFDYKITTFHHAIEAYTVLIYWHKILFVLLCGQTGGV